ncbi:uncharacterized protein LOC119361448 [Triticum dicoccoides]|uniref:uncharacterized protein LOC119361448 n=1 Tax=Triticum dicoccoides TaxID=85692 RepID=UPI001890B573|nr:uncharacterized protein LOC119361448 [Triticum dicoccoides]
MDITPIVLCAPVVIFAIFGPHVRVLLSGLRLRKQSYGTDGKRDRANMKRALNLFYHVTYAHGYVCLSWMMIQAFADVVLVFTVCRNARQHGFNAKVIRAYLQKTKEMCANNPASMQMQNWNLITYGAGLLDSSLPEEYAAGGRVLTMLIDKDVPLQVRRLLIRSPRQRIQKLIGTLAWRSPADQEMRWLAARIVEHLAADLNLAHFPGALECISSLFYQEARLLTFTNDQGIDEDLLLPGLRILEKLAHSTHNCTLICNTNDLLSKIVGPVSSNELTEDIKTNAAWTKVVDVSLKVVSRLMDSSGMTGQKMRGLIASNINAVKNLKAVLDMDMKSNSGIIELQMLAMDVLTQIALHHPARSITWMFFQNLIDYALHIFLTSEWMGDYLKDEKRKVASEQASREVLVEKKMKQAQETVSQLKEKAGEALAMLSCDSEAIMSFTGCDDDVNRLTELLDFDIKTIKCEISATDTMEIEIYIGCRVSAAIILKHLSNYVKAPTLRKALGRLLHVQQDEPSTLESHNNQYGDRKLQVELLSLVAAIRANNNLNLAGILISQTPPDTLEDFVVSLKKKVEDNMYATPAGLAIQKLTCEMVIEFMKHDRNIKVIDNHNIIGTLLKASKAMAGLESRMLFTGDDHDCHGIPLKPLSSVLAKSAEDILTQRKQALGINIVPVGVPLP